MRYRLAVLILLILLAVLPIMQLLAAPAPYPSAVLALGQSPDLNVLDEQYRKRQKEAQSSDVMALRVLHDPEVQKLSSIARMSDPLPWLSKNLRVVEEDGGRSLRFTWRAGTHDEQVTILNAYLRANLACEEASIKDGEAWLRIFEKDLIVLDQRLKSATHPKDIAMLHEAIYCVRTKQVPNLREMIARLKQTAVVKWAR